MGDEEIDIFVSYQRRDIDVVLPVIKELEQTYNLSCWYDQRDVLPGHPTWTSILKAMRRSKKKVLFLSDGVLKSKAFEYELNSAIDDLQGNEVPQVIPVRLDDSSIHPILRQFQYIDARNQTIRDIATRINEGFHKETTFGLLDPDTQVISTPNGTRIMPSIACTVKDNCLWRRIMLSKSRMSKQIERQLGIDIEPKAFLKITDYIEQIRLNGCCATFLVPFVLTFLVADALTELPLWTYIMSQYTDISYLLITYPSIYPALVIGVPLTALLLGSIFGAIGCCCKNRTRDYMNRVDYINPDVNSNLHLLLHLNEKRLDVYKYDLTRCKKFLAEKFESQGEVNRAFENGSYNNNIWAAQAVDVWCKQYLDTFLTQVNIWTHTTSVVFEDEVSRHPVVQGLCFCSYLEKIMIWKQNSADNTQNGEIDVEDRNGFVADSYESSRL